jgi:hypothetical protein
MLIQIMVDQFDAAASSAAVRLVFVIEAGVSHNPPHVVALQVADNVSLDVGARDDPGVELVKADKAKTLDLINKGEGGFLDRDLYVFCANVSDGKVVAIGNPNAKQLIGVDTRTQKDANGKAFGQELYDAYQKPEGQITEVSYMFVRPGPDKTPAPKMSFATKVGDLGCGVGYYK